MCVGILNQSIHIKNTFIMKVAFSELTWCVINFGIPGLAPSSSRTYLSMAPIELFALQRYSPKSNACVTGSYIRMNLMGKCYQILSLDHLTLHEI